MKSKQHDLMLNILANPQATLEDFLNAGLSAKNTSLEDENTYLNIDTITSNPLFQNESGEFDKVKFHNIYLQAAKGMEQMNSEPLDFKAVYSKYNIWAPTEQRENSPGYNLVKVHNPDRITKSMISLGQDGPREFTPQEIAQSQKIWDSEKLKWIDTPEDMFSFSKLFNDFTGFFSDNFGSTKVMATYDEDVDINGKKRGEFGFDESLIEHQKGDYMLNENGTYYYRTLKDGENIYGKLVLHYSDILTREGSALNSIDFLDSDDIQKSTFGSFVKNASLIGSMFLPYVGTAIAGATIFLQAAGLGATLGKIALLDNSSSTMSWLEGISESTNPLNTRSEWSSIDYGNTGRNTTWTIENLLGMVGDVVGQLKQQRLLFEYSPYLLKGKWGMLDPKKQKLLEEQYFNELLKATKGTVLSKLEQKDVAKALNASAKLQAENSRKAATMVEEYMKSYLKAGEELSKAYMTMLTVNDIYSEALQAGADDFDASLVTAGYAAMEYWLLSTDIGKWILPELRGERLLNKAMLHALTKDVKDSFASLRKAASQSDEAKKNYLQKLVDFGKSVARGEFNAGLGKKAAFLEGTGLLKAGVGSLFAGASAEAIEESSEELLGDFARVLFNGLEQLKGKDVRLKPFENVVDRYGMSFLGGFIGGGVSSAMFDFSNVKRNLNMSYNEAMLQLIHKAHNNDLDGIYRILDKEEIGNKNLSASKFDKDEEGNIIWKQGDENDNLDVAIKNLVKRQLSLIQNTLTAHGGKTDDELIDINLLGDLRYGALRNTTTAGLFIQKYNETLTELIKQTLELRNLNSASTKAENGEHDLKEEENADLEAQRKEIEEKIKDLDKKLEEFHSGAKAPLFMATALIESTPFIALALMDSTFKVYAEHKSGKSFENISESELKELEIKYQNYLKSDKKDDLQLATKSYLIMSALQKLNLEMVQEALRKQSKDPLIAQLLSDTSKIFDGLNFEQDSERWLETFGKWAEGTTTFGEGIANEVNLLYNTYRENIAKNLQQVDIIDSTLKSYQDLERQVDELLAKKIKDAEDSISNLGELGANSAEAILQRDTSIRIANEEAEEAKRKIESNRLAFLKELSDKGFNINNLEELKEQANKKNREELNKSILDLIFKTGLQQANKLADTILSLGFINGAIKDLVVDKLVSMSKTLEQTYKLAEKLLVEELAREGIDSVDIESLIELGEGDLAIEMYGQENVDRLINSKLQLKEQYLIPKQDLDAKISKIKKLLYSPIMLNLDSFALNIGKRKVSLLFAELGKIISTTRLNISTFNLSGDLYKQIGEAERVLDLYIATLEGARTDTVDPFRISVSEDGTVTDTSNIWGINKVINEVHAKSPKVENEKWEDLPEIEGEIANMMLEDARRLKNLLHNYKQLYSINQGLKLNVLRRVSTKTHYLLYRKLLSLITNCELPDKEEFERKINDLSFLKELTKDSDTSKWNINLNRELEKQLEKERILMEDAIFEYFLDKLDDIEILKKIFNPKNFVMYNDNPTLLSEGSESIDDSSFIGYLTAKAAIKTSNFLGKFKDILKDGTIAPLIGLEIAVHLGLANFLNGNAVSNITKAYRSSLLEMNSEQRKEFLTKAGYSENIIKAYSTDEGVKLFINDDLVPLYDNIIFVDGIPGAGKSAAVDALIVKYLKAYHTDLVNSAWVSHGGDTEGGKITKEFATRIGFGDSFENVFDKQQLLKLIFPEYTLPKQGENGNYLYDNNDYFIDVNGKIQIKWKIDEKWTKDNVPKVIFIDEAQQFSLIELLAIDKFAKKFGTAVIMSGDLSQSQMHADINVNDIIRKINDEAKEHLLDEKPLHVHLSRNQVLHTPKLGTSMRTSNNLKNVNMANTLVIMGSGEGTLELHYYEDEHNLAGDYQLGSYNIDDVKTWIDKMIPLLKPDEKIHFAVPKGDDEFKTKLQAIEKYNKVIQFHEGVALGQEGLFWIIKFNFSDVNDLDFKLDFYTGQTRSELFSLMLVPETVADGKIKIVNVLDQESHKEEYSPAAIKKYSDEHVKLLQEILPKDITNIEYKERNLEEETPIEHPTHSKEESSTSSEELKDKRKRFVSAAEERLNFEESTTEESNDESDEEPDEEIEVSPEIPPTPDGGPSSGGASVEVVKDVSYFSSEIEKLNSPDDFEKFLEIISEIVDENLNEDDLNLLRKLLQDKSEELGFFMPEENDESLEESEEIDEPSSDYISPFEDLNEEEMKDVLDEENGVKIDSESLLEKESKEVSGLDITGFRFTLYSNSTFELGTTNLNDDTYSLEEQYKGLRIDGVNGIESGVKNGIITDSEWIKIQQNKKISEAERKLGYIRRLLMSQYLTKDQIASLIAKDMGLSGGVYVRFAIKTSSLDTDFESDPFLKLEKSRNERTRYTRALLNPTSESNKVNNRRLVAIIGTNNKDVIEIPLLQLNNPVTIIRALDENHPIRVMFDSVFNNTNGDYGTKQVTALLSVKSATDNKKEYQGLNDLITLYLNTYRHILFIPDLNWTPGKNLDGLGLLLYRKRGTKNYDDTDYVLTRTYNFLDELRKDPSIHHITSPMHLIRKDGRLYNSNGTEFVKIANYKHPFVLYTDQTHDHNGNPITNDEDVMQEFVWQQFNDVPKTVQLIYILPPQFKFEDYMKLLVDFMINKGPSPYGNQRTPYKILEAIFIADTDNNFENVLKCFQDALGKEDGLALFNKTLSVIKELSLLIDYETGEVDILKLVKILTTRTESWNLGNVGIPKSIPLYRQLQNVLKLLVCPQAVVMLEGEDGLLIYLSRKGVDRTKLLLLPLAELFNKSGVSLYHLTVGSKLSNGGIFITILTDENGHFTNGEDFEINGNITSQAFETNPNFNKLLSDLVKKIKPYTTKQGTEIITTSDTVAYVSGYSGWGTVGNSNNTQAEVLPTIHSKIKNKLKRFGYSEEYINGLEEFVKDYIKKKNDDNPMLLLRIAFLINSDNSSNIRAIIVNGELLLGQSNLFKNKKVIFSNGQQTSRGFEIEVTIDGEQYDGTLINGELFLLSKPSEQNTSTQQPTIVDFDLIVERMIELENNWGFPKRPHDIFLKMLNDYKNNPSPENKEKILKNIIFKDLLKTFENNSSDNNITSEEQKFCSNEFKIKFN